MNNPAMQHAISLHQSGNLAEAAALYEQILQQSPNDADALNLLGTLRHAQGRSEEGAALLHRAIQADATNPLPFYNLGIIFYEHKKYGEAAGAFRQACERAPQHADFWLALAHAYLDAKLFDAALATFSTLCEIMPTAPTVWLETAHALETAGKLDEARNAAAHALGLCLSGSNTKLRTQIFAFLNDVDRKRNAPKQQWDWAYLHTQLAPNDANAWVALARIALAHSEYILAEAFLAHAEAIEPRRLDIRWLRTFSLVLPIYANEENIKAQVLRYTQAVKDLHAFVRNVPAGMLEGAETLFEIAHPLFLAYTGEDVVEAQRVTGNLFADIMARRFGAPLPVRQQRNKIHIAFVSETFFYHSNMKLRRSWLARLDRTKYHITCYHVGERADPYTLQIKDMVDAFYHFPNNFEGVLKQLRADAPDIIQYTNIGLRPLTIKLAALRLAPVQCTTWGHPITSGLPTMDYYLSSELMEPADAQSHYTEKLYLLPGLSVVPQPVFNVPDRTYKNLTRDDYGFAVDDVLYLCLQSLQKYLPQYDDVYARIAMRVPRAKFIFVEHAENPAIMELFKLRMRAPFYATGLNPDAHLVFLPFQEQDGYRALHMMADVTLDSLGWSGANTTFEGLELGGLIMTYEGRFMRERHTSACLKLMHVPELITTSIADYVALAIELGNNPSRRGVLRKKLQSALPLLHTDPGVGAALNTFYAEALASYARNPTAANGTPTRTFKKNDGIYKRDYESYDDYVEHQKTKLNYVDLSDYDKEFSADLEARLKQHKLVKRGQSALCLGARVGSECKAFIANGAFTVGIDLNPGADNRYVMVGDFHHLQFADGSVDVAYTNCIDHSFDHSLMMAEVRRVLKNGGLFVADIMNGLGDNKNWKPDEYDCVFWDNANDVVESLASHLGANVTLQQPMENAMGWRGQMVVFKISK